MKNLITKSILCGAVLMGASFSASANFMATDWKVEGDSKALLDHETGIEWLDLTETDTLSINYVMANLDTEFAGWRLPTQAEVVDFVSRFTPTVNVSATRNYASAEDVANWTNSLGLTGTGFSLGWYFAGNELRFTGQHSNGYFYGPGYDYNYNNWRDIGDANLGVFLVSDGGTTISSIENPSLNANNENAPVNQVPLTGSLLLLAGGLAALRRKTA